VFSAVINNQRPPVHEVPDDVAYGLKRCMEQCWSQKPENRPTTDGNMHASLALREIVTSYMFLFNKLLKVG